MKICLLLAALLLPRLLHAQSQGAMNVAAQREFAAADKRLNATYEKFIAALDEKGKTKLRAAERAWIAYRDAEADAEARGGSMEPMSYNNSCTALTEARIKHLKDIAADANH